MSGERWKIIVVVFGFDVVLLFQIFLCIIPLIRFSAVSFQGEFPSVEDMTVAERALHEMRALIRLMQEEVAKAQEKKKKEQEQEEERKKQEEQQAQQEAQKKAAQSAKEKARRKGERIVLYHCKEITFHRSARKITATSSNGGYTDTGFKL